MARKTLLAGPGEKLTAVNSETSSIAGDVAKAVYTPRTNIEAALGGFLHSIEQIKQQGVIELDPALIADRLPIPLKALQDLIDAIRHSGQQVPILVRPHPNNSSRGRRRLRVRIELGRKVRAMVRPPTDQELVVTQDQENSPRTDLAFIERALFAESLDDAGYDRKTIMSALATDKASISRLIATAVKIPRDLIAAIGPVPRTGRGRWIELAASLETAGAPEKARVAAGRNVCLEKSTDDRFAFVFPMTAPSRSSRASGTSAIRSSGGKQIATVRGHASGTTLNIGKKQAGGFGAYVAKALPDLYDVFTRERQASSPNGKPSA